VSLLTNTIATIVPASSEAMEAAEHRQAMLTEPRGSLGSLESLGRRLCAMYGECPPPLPEPVAIAPSAADYWVAGHRPVEPGASAALAQLDLVPLVDLQLRLGEQMRLGEGSGAALAVPMVQAAAPILREVATFDSAGVTDKE
jgi:NaMN:DMB phosphoribosyltransferase